MKTGYNRCVCRHPDTKLSYVIYITIAIIYSATAHLLLSFYPKFSLSHLYLLLLRLFSHSAFQFNVVSSSIRVTNTFMMGVAPAASSGSDCRMERKVSEPSKPSPDRKAPITGITDSSKSSQRTKPCRYCSLNALRNTKTAHLLRSNNKSVKALLVKV